MDKLTRDVLTCARVQAVRGVKSVGGYPYYAWGLYEPTQRVRDGGWYYRLVKSGPSFRSDVHGRWAFAGVPVSDGVRHGSVAPDPLAE